MLSVNSDLSFVFRLLLLSTGGLNIEVKCSIEAKCRWQRTARNAKILLSQMTM